MKSGICQRIRALKYVFEQGFVSLADVKSHLNSQAEIESLRVMFHQSGFGHLRYSHAQHGVWYITDPECLRELRAYFPEFHSNKLLRINPYEIAHALDLCKIRQVLCNYERLKIIDWQSEFYIRSLPFCARSEYPHRKIPDAVCIHQNPDGTTKKLFIEHERTLKSKSRYIDIFRHYAKRPDVTKGGVIYVCFNEMIQRELRKIVKELFGRGAINNLEEVFQFVDFYQLTKFNNGGLIC